jgi:putative endonuclease
MIRCSDASLYTGITNDLQRRWRQHSGDRGGAKYFRGRQPVAVVYLEHGHDRSSASRREAEIKKLQRADKEYLIRSPHNLLHTNSNREVNDVSEQTEQTFTVRRPPDRLAAGKCR